MYASDKNGLSGMSEKKVHANGNVTMYFYASNFLSSVLSIPLLLSNTDPYAVVSFGRYSQTSRVVKESICPTWDQTLIFEGIRLFGDTKIVKKFPPQIVIELYDKDQVVRKLRMLEGHSSFEKV